jgi:hypothetical protein
MTIISHNQRGISRSLSSDRASRFDPAWITVGLVSLCGLAVTALVLTSGVLVDFQPVFLG